MLNNATNMTRKERAELTPMARAPKRQRRGTKGAPKNVFRVIIAAEVVFLFSMWSFIPRVITSPRLRKQSLHSPAEVLSSRFWKLPSMQTPSELQDENEQSTNSIPEKLRYKNQHRRQSTVKRANILPHDEVTNSQRERLPATLVIGGSDGSGTRSFADAMRNLGVPMKTDLRSNLDIQSGEIFNGQGFPPLVNLILKDTRSVNYEVEDLTNETRRVALKETKKFKQGVDRWHKGVEQWRRPRATGVSIGFKAPATMLLLPLLKEVFGPLKYIHVVRDGRDVSLSSNQSPVKKFYNSTYPDAKERRAKYSNGFESVLAMHLWNDWNTQALEWEQTHAKEADFDFIVMRSEDLVDPEKKFESLAQLAAFVGSPKTMKEVCCLSRKDAIDLGQSVNWTGAKANSHSAFERKLKDDPLPLKYGSLQQQRDALGHDEILKSKISRLWGHHSRPDNFREFVTHGRTRNGASRIRAQEESTPTESPPKLHERYGKWRSILKDKPEVSAKLHKEGARGLASFGYEPYQPRLAGARPAAQDFICDERVVCE